MQPCDGYRSLTRSRKVRISIGLRVTSQTDGSSNVFRSGSSSEKTPHRLRFKYYISLLNTLPWLFTLTLHQISSTFNHFTHSKHVLYLSLASNQNASCPLSTDWPKGLTPKSPGLPEWKTASTKQTGLFIWRSANVTNLEETSPDL